MIKIDELIDNYKLHDSLGKDIDFILKLMLFTLIDTPRGYKIVFEMVSENPYLWQKLARDSDLFFENEGSLIAEFKPSEEYPFYRIYTYKYKEQNALPIESFSSILKKNIETKSCQELYYKYRDSELIEKYINWEKKLKQQLSSIVNMVNGRIDNTNIEQIIVLHRQPSGCIVCGQKATGYISTVLMNQQVIFIIASTCTEHQELAKKNPCFLHFLSKLFKIGIDLSSIKMNQKLDKNMISLISDEVIRELDCSLLKNEYIEYKDEFVLVFERDTRVRIILRLATFMDYGYMINKPNGEHFQRIDSAPDHKEIEFFPDHLHRTIKKGKKPDVESSYTFGFPILDLPAIKKMILKLEEEL